MNSKKQNAEKAATAQPTQLDPNIVYQTLYERITKDCLEAQEYLSVTDIVGILELIKLSIFTAYHTEVAKEMSEALREGLTEQ